ncbi:MAG: hypothetical protein IKU86_05995 [Thermoguttaceae bacterium]|nr:hypothetical protein [Thermoguttaceae bacterium]
MKKNAQYNRRRRNAFAWPLAALLGTAFFALSADRAQADDFGLSLNLGCFSLNIGNNDDRCDCAPPVVVAPPKPAPRPIVVAPPKPAPRPILVAPPKPAPGKAPKIAARPTAPAKPAPVVRGQAPNPPKRATYNPVAAARAPKR